MQSATLTPSSDPMIAFFGEPISIYTRAQAIDDGELVDLTPIGWEAGWRWPVAVSASVWSLLEREPSDPQAPVRALHLLRFLAIVARTQDSDRFQITWEHHAGDTRLSVLCGPGDDGEPVLTICLPGEE